MPGTAMSGGGGLVEGFDAGEEGGDFLFVEDLFGAGGGDVLEGGC
jgi:hypothetical protein